jgi:hypothetical protein
MRETYYNKIVPIGSHPVPHGSQAHGPSSPRVNHRAGRSASQRSSPGLPSVMALS